MCFTALVGLVDSQMLQTVLCFFLLPGCSSASQTSQLQTRSGRHHDSCKRPKWFCEGTFICNGWDCQIKWHPFPRLPFPMSNLNQLGAFSENWFCYDNGSAGKHKSTTPGSLYTFWQAKAPKPLPLKQFRTLSIRKYSPIFNTHIKFLRQPATWQVVLKILLKLGYREKNISMQFRQFTSIQVALGAYVHISGCLPFANWMHGWKDGRILQMDGSVQAQSSVHWYNALSNVLFFFSLEALLLGKALARIFSILWPSLLGCWLLWRERPNKPQLVTSCHIYQNLSESIINHTTNSNMIKPK